MPMHDWTRVPSGLFHHFHQSWSIRLTDALNAGRLPKGIAALVEQRAGPREGDVLAIETNTKPGSRLGDDGGVATIQRPVTRIVRRTSREFYSRRANRIVIKHHLGRTLAVIEIVSPGNKHSSAALREFVDNSVEFLRADIHVLVVDLFPPTRRDPFGIHKPIWDEIIEEDFVFPAGKDRTLVSYEMGDDRAAYIEPVAVGDVLPNMPLFLTNALIIPVPLEPTYMAAWEASPEAFREAVETGVLPETELSRAVSSHHAPRVAITLRVMKADVKAAILTRSVRATQKVLRDSSGAKWGSLFHAATQPSQFGIRHRLVHPLHPISALRERFEVQENGVGSSPTAKRASPVRWKIRRQRRNPESPGSLHRRFAFEYQVYD